MSERECLGVGAMVDAGLVQPIRYTTAWAIQCHICRGRFVLWEIVGGQLRHGRSKESDQAAPVIEDGVAGRSYSPWLHGLQGCELWRGRPDG